MEKEYADIDLLLKLLQQGSEKAFRSLCKEFYASLCLFATHYLGDQEAAADIVQESFLKYWNKRADFDNYCRIKSFLYVVVRHACLNQLRSQNLRLHVSDEFIKDSEQDFYNYGYSASLDTATVDRNNLLKYIVISLLLQAWLPYNNAMPYPESPYRRLFYRLSVRLSVCQADCHDSTRAARPCRSRILSYRSLR